MTVTGGTGGAGGAAQGTGSSGSGGDGGIGLLFAYANAVFQNLGKLFGGKGGAAGTGSQAPGSAGRGGAGLVGTGLDVVNAGSIKGGMSGDNTVQADAIDFTGGTSALTLSQNGVTGTLSGGLGVGGTLRVDPGTAAGTAATVLTSAIHDYTDPDSGTTTAGSLVKVGLGALTLSGVETYTGATKVNAGTLLVDGSTSATSGVTVANGATLGGGGTVGGSIAEDGTLSASAKGGAASSIGTLTTGALTLKSDATFREDLGGPTSADLVKAGGAVQIDGTLDLESGGQAFTTAAGQSVTLIDNTSATAKTTGRFAKLVVNGGASTAIGTDNTVQADGRTYRIDYGASVDGGNNDVVLTDVTPTLAPTIGLVRDTGASPFDGITFNPTVTGQDDAGAAVTITDENGNTLYSFTGDGGTYTLNPAGQLAQGAHTLIVTETLASATASASTSLTYDSTPPTVYPAVLTVGQNSGPTPIGITAPSDAGTAPGSLSIVVGFVPLFGGTVTLSDGTSVVAGQSLSAKQLQGLRYAPRPVLSSSPTVGTQVFTYTVTDSAGNANQGMADLNVNSPTGPTITGTHTTADAAERPVTPFAGVTVADASPGAIDDLFISLAKGAGTLSGNGLQSLPASNSYELGPADPTTLSAELDALTFTPINATMGTTSTANFHLSLVSNESSFGDDLTVVTDTADAVSLGQNAPYKGGVFTLAGTASSGVGVSKVEIFADVDGVRTDLGAASVDGTGHFVYEDAVGAHTQAFITAVLTDGDGKTTSGQVNYSLTGGLGQFGVGGRQDFYTPDGSASPIFTKSGYNGSQTTSVDVPAIYHFNGSGDVAAAAQNLASVISAQLSRGSPIATYSPGSNPPSGTLVITSGPSAPVQPPAAFTSLILNQSATDPSVSTGASNRLILADAGAPTVVNPIYSDVQHTVVTDFRVDGDDHAVIFIDGASYNNSIAEVLHNTSNKAGGATITNPDTGYQVVLPGVTKGQLVQNQQDFIFA